MKEPEHCEGWGELMSKAFLLPFSATGKNSLSRLSGKARLAKACQHRNYKFKQILLYI